MNHTISCQIISQNPNSVNWIGGFYFEPDQSFNHVFNRFPEFHSPPSGLPLIEVEHVSTTPDIATNPDSTSHRSKLSGHICVWSSCQACESDNGNPGNFLYYWALRIETSLAITHPDRPHEDERMKPLTPWAVRKAAAVSRFAAQGPGAPAM